MQMLHWPSTYFFNSLHLKLHQISTAQLCAVLKYVCLNSFEELFEFVFNQTSVQIWTVIIQRNDTDSVLKKTFYILSWERSFFHLSMKKFLIFLIVNLLNNSALNAHQSLSRPHVQKHPCPYPLSIKGFNAPCRSSQWAWDLFLRLNFQPRNYSLTPDFGAVFFYRLLLCHLSPRCAWILLWQCLQSEMRFDVSCVPPSDKGLMWCTSSTGTITPFLKHCSQKGCVCA